ncbi:MAG: glycosyltransferase family 4 protein [Neisseriaceae bacterium]
MNHNLKVAIVCDWLVTVGGAEKVLIEMLKCYPYADVFCVIDFIPDDKRNLFLNKKITTTFIQKLPFAKTKYRNYLPLMPIAIEQLDLQEYDIIISSSHAVSKGIIVGPHQTHICYCHSPMRYAWDLQFQYLKESNLVSGLKSWIVRYFLHKIRIWDVRTNNGVDYFIANSKYIAKRIKKIYRRESKVIYPPVEIKKDISLLPYNEKEDFYLSASRLVPYKKIDLIVEAFIKMADKKLIVIGDGPDMKKIRKLAANHPNIQIMGYQPDKVLHDKLSKARAFVFAAIEDFGIIPVEAQSYGCPVIAFNQGGVTESVIDYRSNQQLATGVFFDEQTADSINEAVNYFETIYHFIDINNCHKNAAYFSSKRFKEQLIDYINEVVEYEKASTSNV